MLDQFCQFISWNYSRGGVFHLFVHIQICTCWTCRFKIFLKPVFVVSWSWVYTMKYLIPFISYWGVLKVDLLSPVHNHRDSSSTGISSWFWFNIMYIFLYVKLWHWNYGRKQILLTSIQKVDNVIPTQYRHVSFGYTLQVWSN